MADMWLLRALAKVSTQTQPTKSTSSNQASRYPTPHPLVETQTKLGKVNPYLQLACFFLSLSQPFFHRQTLCLPVSAANTRNRSTTKTAFRAAKETSSSRVRRSQLTAAWCEGSGRRAKGITHPPSWISSGDALSLSTAGATAQFELIARDEYGNKRPGGDHVEVGCWALSLACRRCLCVGCAVLTWHGWVQGGAGKLVGRERRGSERRCDRCLLCYLLCYLLCRACYAARPPLYRVRYLLRYFLRHIRCLLRYIPCGMSGPLPTVWCYQTAPTAPT
eukprot:2036697-Rhodomonas_salina.2